MIATQDFIKNKTYSVREIAEALEVSQRTVINAIKTGALPCINVSTSSKKANYKIIWQNVLYWLNSFSDVEVFINFVDFYATNNWIQETKKVINDYFDNLEKNDNK